MTTKWSKNRKLQRKPPVCRKPPPALPVDPPSFNNWPPQGQLVWNDMVASYGLSTAVAFRMLPGYTAGSYDAILETPPFWMNVFIWNNPATSLQSIVVAVYDGAVMEEFRYVLNHKPRSFQPYDSGLVQLGPAANMSKVRLRIMS